jgi:hypothetical protein
MKSSKLNRLLEFGFLLVSAIALVAEEPVASPTPAEEPAEVEIESPSPDGRFSFLSSFTPDERTLDLIEKKSQKVLLRVAESEQDSNRLDTEVLWAPDSKRFALMISVSRRSADVAVYGRSGDTFREIKLPELPDPIIPDKLDRDKDHFWHVSESGWAKPVRWQKNGSLVVDIQTTIDGNDNFAEAIRTVVLGFDKSGKAKILKSTQKVRSHIKPEN